MLTLLTHILTWASESFVLQVPHCPLNISPFQCRRVKSRSPLWPCPPWREPTSNFGKYIWRLSWGCGKTYPVVSRYLSLSPMFSIWSGLKHEIPFESFNPPSTAMPDIGTLQQLKNCIAKMEWCHEEELRKLRLTMINWRLISNTLKVITLPERTLGESHTRCTVNTQDNPSLSHMNHVFSTCHSTKWHVHQSMRCTNLRSTLGKAYRLVKPKVHPWWVL